MYTSMKSSSLVVEGAIPPTPDMLRGGGCPESAREKLNYCLLDKMEDRCPVLNANNSLGIRSACRHLYHHV